MWLVSLGLAPGLASWGSARVAGGPQSRIILRQVDSPFRNEAGKASLTRVPYPAEGGGVTAIDVAHGQNPSRILGAAQVDHVGQLAIWPANAPHPRMFIIRDDFGENLCRFAVVQSVDMRHPHTWPSH